MSARGRGPRSRARRRRLSETDADSDQILDPQDHCPLQSGPANTTNPVCNGCPGRACITEEGSIQILDRVEFGTDSDVILAASNSILTDVHDVMVANTQLLRIRVEGHTDDRGNDARNLDLSQRRAQSVVRWLVEHGIAAERLEAQGYGETRPLQTNATPAGRQTNRRVEFHVVDPAPPEAAAHN
jgi:outer membrane protein OmpA-like peptidoglycan-associated protein